MARKVIALTVILIMALFLNANVVKDYKTHVVNIEVKRGDTLDEIAGEFYERDKRGLSWDEYRQEIWELNRKLQNSKRCIQPSDVVEVRYYD